VQTQTIARELLSKIEVVERDSALREEPDFARRAEALDYLEFQVIDRIAGLVQTSDDPEALDRLTLRAETVRLRLEAVDDALFQRLRARIRAGDCTGAALRSLIDTYVGPDSLRSRRRDEPGYDGRDAFINGLLLNRAVPPETMATEPEMVPYQQTPARIILQLADDAHLEQDDVFYDLGCGLGQVPILVNLLSGAVARGVEVEPAYCAHARACATGLGLSRVEFVTADARALDYSEGTVFYLFTPFTGGMLQEVLTKLQSVSRGRRIRLFTYGPCTAQVSKLNWLKSVGTNPDQAHRLAAFESAEAGAPADEEQAAGA